MKKWKVSKVFLALVHPSTEPGCVPGESEAAQQLPSASVHRGVLRSVSGAENLLQILPRISVRFLVLNI